MKSCPKCGILVSPENNICPNCGRMVSNVENNQVINVATVPAAVVQSAPESATAPTPVVPMTPVATIPDASAVQVPPMPAVAPMPQTPQVVENAITVAQAPIQATEIAQPVEGVTELVSAIPEALEPMSSISVAEVPTVEPTALEPVLNSNAVEIPTADTVLSETEQKEEKKNKKCKNEPLTSEEKEKKFGRITTVIIIIISVVAIAIISTFMYKMVKENEVCETNGVVVPTQYSYKGFDFFIPNGVVASVENEAFVLRDAENTWSAVITINDGSYNSLVSNKSQISSYFEQLEYVSTTAEEKEISGTSFVTTEVLMGSQNVLIAYAKASGTKIYGVVYTNKLGTYDNYSLNIVGEVLASAIYSGYDSAMPTGFTIDMFEQTFDVSK